MCAVTETLSSSSDLQHYPVTGRIRTCQRIEARGSKHDTKMAAEHAVHYEQAMRTQQLANWQLVVT